MNYHKTYTIPFRLLSRMQCGMASGHESQKRKLVYLYMEFERLAGRDWVLYPVSSPLVSENDITDRQELSIECDLMSY